VLLKQKNVLNNAFRPMTNNSMKSFWTVKMIAYVFEMLSVKECVFVNSALKIQCHYCQKYTAFSAILPTGRYSYGHNILRQIFSH